jgi:methyl-accepting chemotaxis protein-2 (aspartate sensor receptor)
MDSSQSGPPARDRAGRMTVGWKLSLAACLVLIVVMCAALGFVSSMIWRDAREQGEQTLAATVDALSEVLHAYDEAARRTATRDFAVFQASFDSALTWREAQGADGQPQPQVLYRGKALNGDFDIVDRFTRLTGATATIFARTGDDFQRISTSLKKSDGSRAMGTLLDRQHPAYRLVLDAKAYTGRATLFGRPYMTHYEPILQDGRVIGILYVGSDLTDVYGVLGTATRAQHPFQAGAVYTVDLKAGPNAGSVLGLEQARQLAPGDPPAAEFLKRLQDGGERGGFEASWTPHSAGAPGGVTLVSFVRNGDWNWAVVAEAPRWAVMARAQRTLTVLWAAGLIALVLLLAALTALSRRLVARPIRRLVDSLSHLARNDLSQELTTHSDDEIGRLAQSMEHFRRQLAMALAAVHGDARELASASSTIADGSRNLSLRTGEQIDLLKYTFSTMGRLNDRMQGNTHSAKQATQLALQASEMAARGGADVEQIVHTMERIDASAKTIAGIISVIDGIAFQTNILALNAAVEAARDGEQGRGFAVVASEVRALAQRSAEAARDIKALISDSVEQVEQGVVLVGHAGRTIGEVVSATKRVSDMIGEVRSANNEQSASVDQVAEAVTSLDRSTQQNVALVADSAAAAQGLKDQADRLLQAVSVFRLEATETA